MEDSGRTPKIRPIPYEVPRAVVNVPLLVLAVLFVASIGFLLYYKSLGPEDQQKWGEFLTLRNLVAFVTGLVAAMGIVVLLQKRGERRRVLSGWTEVRAKCLGRDVFERLARGARPLRRTWDSQILCEFELAGQRHRVTPKVSDMTWGTQAKAHTFLNERIDNAGECTLRVNPENPLQTVLMPQDSRMFRFMFLVCGVFLLLFIALVAGILPI